MKKWIDRIADFLIVGVMFGIFTGIILFNAGFYIGLSVFWYNFLFGVGLGGWIGYAFVICFLFPQKGEVE